MIKLFQPRALLINADRLTSRPEISKICRVTDIPVIVDMTETAGLIASGLAPRPFDYADVVLAGTQGSLRGPSGALIFSRKNVEVMSPGIKDAQAQCGLGEAVDQSVFPGHQGGPHNHAITAMAVALGQAASPSFRKYQEAVLENAKALATALSGFGYHINTTDRSNHEIAMNVGEVDLGRLRHVLSSVGIITDLESLDSQLRLGSLAMSSRGLGPGDFYWIAAMIHRCVKVVREAKEESVQGTDISMAGGNIGEIPGIVILEMRRMVRDKMEKFALAAE